MSLHTSSLCPLLWTRFDAAADALRKVVKGFRTYPFCIWFMALVFCCSAARAQTNEWTWMGGDVAQGSFGVYGTLGTPAPPNLPGAREKLVSWKDSKGNFWLFGGEGYDSVGSWAYLNDLWEYVAATGEWAWMGGSNDVGGSAQATGVYGVLGTPAAGNIPPGRSGAVSWTDAKGNLWMFGGVSYDPTNGAGNFNDLWEYNPSTSEWAWMGGSQAFDQRGVYGTEGQGSVANIPGARSDAVAWVDKQGNLWLFGGYGCDSTGNFGNLNDLWEFNPSTNQWTWVSGAKTINQLSVPGTLGTPAAGNVPAARSGAVGWTDNKGNFWLFGGLGIDETGGSGVSSSLNDLWEYNPATNEWAWMSGVSATTSFVSGQPGVYGALQTPAAGNVPGSRSGAVGWTDNKGNLWLFGGEGFDSNTVEGALNDLWEYNTSNGDWSWMGGSDSVAGFCATLTEWCGQLGVYGTEQVPALGNFPGGLYNGTGWTDSKGYFWLFGGEGIDERGDGGDLNGLWEFQPNTGGLPVTATPIISPASGTYATWQTVTIDDSTPGTTINYLINGTLPASEYTGPFQVASTETIEAIASAAGYANSNIASASYTENLTTAATPVFSIAPGNYATAQTVAISDATPGTTIYYAIGAAPTMPNIVYSGPITVSSTETLRAVAVAENYMDSAVATAAYNIGSDPSGEWTWMGGSNLMPASCANQIECGAAGWYGTLGVAAPANIPGARGSAATWTDNKGNFWLFGGYGYDSFGKRGYLNDLWEFSPSTGLWTWMGGSDRIPACSVAYGCGAPGTYGTQGAPASTNWPGARQGPASWTDSQGDLWLFGGFGFDDAGSAGALNDVWKFDPSTDEWTWMGGSENLPSIASGQPGEYGTSGTPAAENIPGGRSPGTEWTDRNGNFWLFGGLGFDSRDEEGYLNDLWEFNPSKNEWTWEGGDKFISYFLTGWPGVYGTLGIPAPVNIPWSPVAPATWTDSDGHLWLFGGIGEDVDGTGYYLNDMWEYFPSLNEWAWTNGNSGSAGGNPLGVYGTLGEFAPDNIPSERVLSASWTDSNGNFWLFGGGGVQDGVLNDLWEFKPSINEWRWMSGSNSIPSGSFGLPGQYGTLGKPAAGNTSGGRARAAFWTDASGNLWLFGGLAFDAQGSQGVMNDLWEYTLAGTPVVPPPVPTASPVFSLAAGTYTSIQTLTISDPTPGSTIYYTTNGTVPNANSAIYSTPISVSASETVNAVAVASGYAVSPIASAAYTIDLPLAATPTFSVPGGTYTSAQTVTISDSTAGATIYYTTDGTTPTTSSTVYSGAITISSTETIEATAVATGYGISAVASATYTINLPPNFTFAASPSSLTVYSGTQKAVTLTVSPQNGFSSTVTFACSGLPSGASCSFNPAQVTPSGGNAATTQLTISVSASTADVSPGSKPGGGPLVPGATFALAGVFLICFRRRSLRRFFLIVILVACAGMVSGCGGGGATGGSSGGGPTPVTSTVTVTATSGSIQQTAKITLTVN